MYYRRWRQIDGGPAAFDVRVSPDGQPGADGRAAGRRGARRCHADLGRVQHVVGQPAIRERADHAQEVAVRTGRRTAEPPATCWTRRARVNSLGGPSGDCAAAMA